MATMTEIPATVGRQTPYHDYHADASVLSAQLQRPIEQKIEPQSPVSLNDRRGGHFTRYVENVSVEGLISFTRGETRVSGSRSKKTNGWVTLSTSIIEGLRVFEIITADRVVSQVSTEHPYEDGHFPAVTFLGTQFTNLSVGGFPLSLNFKFDICGKRPAGGRSYLQDSTFLNGVRQQTAKIADAKGLPTELKARYDERLANIDQLIAESDTGRAAQRRAKDHMLGDREHRQDSDSRGGVVREPSGDPGLRIGGSGRDRSRPEDVQGHRQALRLFHSDGNQHEAGLRGRRRGADRDRYGQWPQSSLRLWSVVLLLLMPLCCDRSSSPQADFDHAYRALVHGELIQCQAKSKRGFSRFRDSSPRWALRFRILEARALLEQGQFQDSLDLLSGALPGSEEAEFAIPTAAIAAVARIRLHDSSGSQQALTPALDLCNVSEFPSCGDLFQSAGVVAGERSDLSSAEKLYARSLLFARAHGDRFLESNSLLNLGYDSIAEERFDEAADRSEMAYQSARTIDASVIALVAQGNIGWAYYRLGDLEKALTLSLEAEAAAAQLGDVFDRENLLTNLGYIYIDQRKFDLAAQSFQKALTLAEGIKAKEDIYNALRVLARLALQTGDLDKASGYAEQALQIAHAAGIHADELYPMLVEGQIAAQRGDAAKAARIFETVEHDPACPVFLKWEAQHSFAHLYEGQGQAAAADREYRTALSTFEAVRSTVRREDFQISFLTNGAHIYDDYIHFLVTQGKPEQALRWADYSRARTLSEGLGLLSHEHSSPKSKQNQLDPPPLDARTIAKRAGGTLLFYWLGEKQSYLWAITPRTVQVFALPPSSEIEAAVQHYRAMLTGPQEPLETEDGRALYRMLIAPAQSLLEKNAKVFVLPDGGLNNLNFETLVVPSPQPHYWIEDADVANSSSLRVLAASIAGKETGSRKLLLMGNSVAVSSDYPELPKAADQMASVAQEFPAKDERVYQREQATPAAYLQNHPEQFSHIHFVAHGTASRLSPLDSAIVLSKDPGNSDSFKLYARDIIQHRLRADLVTISACYGSGERAYSGEGLVGLAWAFLRAGARNVIAALWDVSDASTDQLMDRFYGELAKGSPPDAALRAAKLSLLKNSAFRSPFYWAAFQLYKG